MGAIQTLINGATSLLFNKNKPTAQTISRGQRLRTQSRGPSIYRFIVGLNPGYKYDTSRDLLVDYDELGRDVEETVSLSNASGLAWLMEYQGELDAINRGNLYIDSAANSNIVLNVSAVSGFISSTAVLFEKGDFIQPDNSRYPYQATEQVLRGNANVVTVPVHREIISEANVTLANANVLVGTNCTFTVKMTEKPLYGVAPTRFIVWDSNMALIEVLD